MYSIKFNLIWIATAPIQYIVYLFYTKTMKLNSLKWFKLG